MRARTRWIWLASYRVRLNADNWDRGELRGLWGQGGRDISKIAQLSGVVLTAVATAIKFLTELDIYSPFPPFPFILSPFLHQMSNGKIQAKIAQCQNFGSPRLVSSLVGNPINPCLGEVL